MRKIYKTLGIALLLLFSCNLSIDNFEEKDNFFDSLISIANDSLFIDNISQTDGIFFIDDSVFVWVDNELIFQSFFQKLKMIGGDINNPKEIQDNIFLMAQNVIFVKGIKSAGHSCHIPEIENVKIYSYSGDTASVPSNLFSCFLGNSFNNPLNTWGLYTDEAEGDLYGFLIVKPNAKFQYFAINDDLDLGEQTYEAKYNAKNQLVFPFMGRTNESKNISLTIDSLGKYFTKIEAE